MRAAGSRPALAIASMNFAEVPNRVIAVSSARSNSAAAVGMDRRSVVEHQRRLRGERRHQPVPHHPAAGGEVEDSIAAADVAVELMLFQVLDQRPAGAMHDALGDAGRARRKHDVERMVEREPLVAASGVCGAGARNSSHRTACGIARAPDEPRREERRPRADAGSARAISAIRGQAIVRLAGICVTVRGDQHARRDLAEAVEHALHTEIRRARRPHGADCGCAERRDDGLGDVRKVAGDPVARRRRRRAAARRESPHRRPSSAAVSARWRPASSWKTMAGVVVAAAQQVLGEVQRRVGKEARAGHAIEIDRHPLAAVADDAA